MGQNLILNNFKYLLIWIVFLAIIYFLKKFFKSESFNRVKNNQVQVEDRGIRVKYNNSDLKIICGDYFLNGKITKEQLSNGISKEEWIKLNNQMLIGLTDFTEEDMLIPWEAINSWKRELTHDGEMPHLSVYIDNMKIPIKVDLGLTGISKKVSYFKRMIPEKQKGIDPVMLYIILIILVPILLVTLAMILK